MVVSSSGGTDTSGTGRWGRQVRDVVGVGAHGGEDLVGGDAAVLAPGPLQAHVLGAAGPAQIAVQAAPVGLELAGVPAAARTAEQSGAGRGHSSCPCSHRFSARTLMPSPKWPSRMSWPSCSRAWVRPWPW